MVLQVDFSKTDPSESPLSSEPVMEQVLREVLFNEKGSASRMNHLVMVLPLEEDLRFCLQTNGHDQIVAKTREGRTVDKSRSRYCHSQTGRS